MVSKGSSNEQVEQRPDSTIIPQPRALSNEIISRVFSHVTDQRTLYECLFVNKQFRSISTPLLWHRPGFDKSNDWDLFLGCLMNATPSRRMTLGRYVHHLNLGVYWRFDNDVRELLPNATPRIHYELGGTGWTLASVEQLAQHCQHLTTLSINVWNMKEDFFIALGQHCAQLYDIEWYADSNQPPAWLNHLTCPLRRLRYVSHYVYLDDDGIDTIQGFNQLRCLELYLDFPQSLTYVLDDSPWPHLTRLCMKSCSDIDEHIWADFLASHPRLTYLDLENVATWTPTTLPPLPNLSHLAFHGNNNITSFDLRRYIQTSERLASVRIRQCDSIHLSDFPETTPNNEFPVAICLDQRAIATIKRT